MNSLERARAVICALYPHGTERTLRCKPSRWECIEDHLFGAQLMTEFGTDEHAELQWAMDTARAMGESAYHRNLSREKSQ